MFSRVVTIVAVVMLALALVGGSAYILLNETGAESSRQTQAHAGAGGATYRGDGQGARAQGTGNRSGDGRSNGGSGHSAAGSASQYGKGRGQGTASEGADHPLETWTTISGTVVALDGSGLAVQTGDGLLTVNVGPAWYVETTGVALEAGDTVEISGFDEDGTFQVARIVDRTSGETLLLRDEMGRPLWAGQGRRGE
jgi:hypothetical protein